MWVRLRPISGISLVWSSCVFLCSVSLLAVSFGGSRVPWVFRGPVRVVARACLVVIVGFLCVLVCVHVAAEIAGTYFLLMCSALVLV